MNIDRAKQIKVGDTVSCPPDRDEPGYTGRVTHVGTTEYETLTGTKYIWITVKRPHGHASTWSSNRLD